MNEIYDVAVIGGGAAGLSAALVLGRARRRVVIIDAAQPRNAPASHMHGFLSRDGMPPGDLLEVGRSEVQRYGVSVLTGTVEAVVTADDGDMCTFRLTLGGGERLAARRILVATGLTDELPPVAGLRERWARDVLHCPYCHGWEVRDKHLGVLIDGSTESVRYAHIIRQWSSNITVFAPVGALHSEDLHRMAARGMDVVTGTVTHLLVEHDRLVGLQVDSAAAACEALFVPPRFVPHAELLVALGAELDERGWVVRDPLGRTSVPGLWVAGNVVNPRAQVITAAGEGSAAAIDLNGDLVDEDIRHAVQPTR